LAELTRRDPKSALIEDAIYQYATIKDPASRTRRVASIIAPVLHQIRGVVPSEAPHLKNIATATAAAASDDTFTDFLDAAWNVGGYLTIPCAALVRRPALLNAFGERFAPSDDCDATLPPTPRLDALIDAADRVQPPCDGTIVQDEGAIFDRLMIAIRLNIRDAWSEYSGDLKIEKDEKRFRTSHADGLHGAVDEMTNYYVANFRMPSAAARSQAKQVVDLAADGPFGLCD
jgi:hypothetical protein